MNKNDFRAIDARTKLIVSNYTGKRDYASTDCFVADLAERVVGTVQITCDGWAAYPDAIRSHLLGRLHLAVMQKNYQSDGVQTDSGRRYSPGAFVSVTVETKAGAPHIDKIGTSFVERVNLTVRTHNRRFVRLDSATQRSLRITGIRSRCSLPHTISARSIRQREHRQPSALDSPITFGLLRN